MDSLVKRLYLQATIFLIALLSTSISLGTLAQDRVEITTKDVSFNFNSQTVAINNQGVVLYHKTMPFLMIIGTSYFLMLPVTWIILLFVRPLWLFKLNIILKHFDFAIPYANRRLSVSPRTILLVRFFARYPQVMDAWVEEHLDVVQREFMQLETVRDRLENISIPVVLDGVALPRLTSQHMATIFNKPRTRLLILGENAVLTRSLAIQIGLWSMNQDVNQQIRDRFMFPVLIEQVGDINDPLALICEIRAQLQQLTRTRQPICDDLLHSLLRQRRVLVIVNYFVELTTVTRSLIYLENSNFPIHTLIIVSNQAEAYLGGDIANHILKLSAIAENNLWLSIQDQDVEKV